MDDCTSQDTSLIPPGSYCDHFVKDLGGGHHWVLPCPYWEQRADKPHQENGYCHFLKCGDWEDDGTLLLWDSCKECGIKRDGQGEDGECTNQEVAEWMKRVLTYLTENECRIENKRIEDYPAYKEAIINRIEELKCQNT